MARRSNDGYLDRLSAVPLFRGLDPDELEAVAAIGTEVPMAEGAELTTEGGVAHEAFLIMEGTAECRRGDEVVAQFGVGDFFGEMALISQRPRNATVTATSDGTVRAFHEAEFKRLLHDAPNVAVSILLITAERLLDTEDAATH